ncbi:MAG: RnfABCDGE type electron transport complex subunit D [Desulfarculaceae bacterium]|nr:RnfABCDGE type electron transport complex subunit D [Desulfarculaceae bacterium]MCF8047953.1 RnfABCDGE type electron transport complex subunit D [Desulfarculaceae bacterium]MCF8065333.1 RnfABCDGE type electron transport complex subunit D [Desulfarculaceae bacterium]MCF8099572.1 RnfABCDGE type electron transport complex subunit D [Desulfarculaceae bacterium]
MNEQLLTVSTSPHKLGCMSVRSMYLEYIIAMAPALLVGLYYFGFPALITLILTVASAVVSDFIVSLIRKKPSTLSSLHILCMGLMLGMILPPGAPWWLPVIGGALTVFLGISIFGGIGAYPMNPVLVAWVALAISWPEAMNSFLEPMALGSGDEWNEAETLLMQLKGDISTLEMFEMSNVWLGNVAGYIGSTSAWALLAGGVYLIIRRIIPWQIPVGALLGAAGMALVAAYTDPRILELGYEEFGANMNIVWFHLGAGGLMIAAFFLGPEPVSSPVTPWGTLLFGVGIGLMAIIVRTWGGLVDGAFYGVLLMNAATPLLDRIRPRVIGKVVSGA